MIACENGYPSNISGRNGDFHGSNPTLASGRDMRAIQCPRGHITAGGLKAAIASAPAAGTSNRCDLIRSVDSFATIDVDLGYAFGDKAFSGWTKGVKIAIDAPNLFDAKPLFMNITNRLSRSGR
jgi:hypothetical protein